LSPVKDNKVIGNIINISEEPFVIDELSTSHLNWEPYTDNIFLINNTNERETKGVFYNQYLINQYLIIKNNLLCILVNSPRSS
jgi:hypothetical protein